MTRVRKVLYATLGLVIPGAAVIYGLLPASAATAGPIKGLGGKCIDVAGASSTNGAAIQLYDCNNSAAQQWSVGNTDQTIRSLGKCLDVTAAATANGAKIQLYDCNATGAQKWTFTNGTLVNAGSGKCLDVTDKSTANGARLQIWTCSTTANQTWVLPGGTSPTSPTPTSTTAAPTGKNLDDPAKKDVAMQIVSAAENSSLNWRAQFSYIEDIKDGRGYTAGIIGFCSGTGDMLELVEAYTATKPSNVLAKYLPALRNVNGTESHAGLDPNFTRDWKTAAADSVFQAAQESERDRVYFNPSVRDGKSDGVRALGQFAYYDASVVHGYEGMRSIRTRALKKAKPPAQGGDERAWLNAFMDERVVEMKKEEAHSDVSRIDTAQRVFLNNGNFDLNTPLDFKVYGDSFHIG
ncbi:chitosanase [Actinoplanes awajinensis]|uniref:Glycoside hydrolase n=1 Tax=Actinoplanes awajinensis subsp. mycoplanecinus TaxID=135947 RepID=A0A101JK00_9ACTN|nr:chitosanase [Actinoplanes awajinensis]KUL27816.1 glycoside hydrolase [Actinoplanes awajinensis subsp. mycoplanecinus]